MLFLVTTSTCFSIGVLSSERVLKQRNTSPTPRSRLDLRPFVLMDFLKIALSCPKNMYVGVDTHQDLCFMI